MPFLLRSGGSGAEFAGKAEKGESSVMSERIEELLQSPFLVIDVLPEQVPVNSPGQYFAVERYFLSGARLSALKRKHADLILKLNPNVQIILTTHSPAVIMNGWVDRVTEVSEIEK